MAGRTSQDAPLVLTQPSTVQARVSQDLPAVVVKPSTARPRVSQDAEYVLQSNINFFQIGFIFGGNFQDALGVPVAFGQLYLQINQNAYAFGLAQISNQLIAITLDANGNAPLTPLWFNDVLSPNGTLYVATLFSSYGADVWGMAQQWTFAGSQPIDLSTRTNVNG